MSSCVVNSEIQTSENIEVNPDKMPLSTKWVFWSHSVMEKSWSLSSYERIFEIENVGDLLKVYNLLNKIDIRNHHYFIMRDGIDPTWEDPANRNGGICSFRTELLPYKHKKQDGKFYSIGIFKDFLLNILANNPFKMEEDLNGITGISIAPNKSFGIVKIWNTNSKIDTSQRLNNSFSSKYSNVSIKYRANVPEH